MTNNEEPQAQTQSNPADFNGFTPDSHAELHYEVEDVGAELLDAIYAKHMAIPAEIRELFLKRDELSETELAEGLEKIYPNPLDSIMAMLRTTADVMAAGQRVEDLRDKYIELRDKLNAPTPIVTPADEHPFVQEARGDFGTIADGLPVHTPSYTEIRDDSTQAFDIGEHDERL